MGLEERTVGLLPRLRIPWEESRACLILVRRNLVFSHENKILSPRTS